MATSFVAEGTDEQQAEILKIQEAARDAIVAARKDDQSDGAAS